MIKFHTNFFYNFSLIDLTSNTNCMTMWMCRWTELIISARLADKNDRRSYNGYYQIDGKGWAKALE